MTATISATAPKAHVEQKFRVIHENPGQQKHDIRPKDITVLASGTVGCFGKHEVERQAGHLLEFFQARGWWVSFSLTELFEFYKEKGWDPNFMFFGLLGHWYSDSLIYRVTDSSPWIESGPYLVQDCDGRYSITDLFIEACARK